MITLALLAINASASSSLPPTILNYPNVNSAFTITSSSGRPYYRLVASQSPSLESCAASAASWLNASAPSERCLSATLFKAPSNASYLNQCWCYILPKWIPFASPEADSAQLLWPCTGSGYEQCSFNGVCSAQGACECDAGWRGPRCAELDLLPVDAAHPGLRLKDTVTGANISTWGAPMIQDDSTGTWHAWASEMLNGCGINSWVTNSHIVHATAPAPGGPWTRQEEVVPAFAHEPDVVKGPDGELVMVYSFWDLPNASTTSCTNCSNGVTLGEDFKNGCGPGRTHSFRQMMAIAPCFDCPWGEPTELVKLSVPWDWNLALAILPNRTAVGLLRALFPWRASNYSDNTTWHAVGGDPQGPALPDSNVEDPAVWVGRHGEYHAIFHAMDVAGQGQPYLGGHAYSVDGGSWVYTGTAYGNSANFSDGSWQTFLRRERPHLLFAPDGVTPLALSNGVQFAAGEGVTCEIGGGTSVCDPIFTLVTPINHASRASV